MQYQFAGTDPQGRLIYQPVHSSINAEPLNAGYSVVAQQPSQVVPA